MSRAVLSRWRHVFEHLGDYVSHHVALALRHRSREGTVGAHTFREPLARFVSGLNTLIPNGSGRPRLVKRHARSGSTLGKYSVSKLVGSPPGYVGYEEGGRLTERVPGYHTPRYRLSKPS